MTREQFLKNLSSPKGQVDIILDTDAYNEIDDQFAIGYMLKAAEKLNVKGICAAPFLNARSETAGEGMHKSYDEIIKLLKLTQREDLLSVVFKGSENYLPDEATPVESQAADFMADSADGYSPENPLYIVAIGAITNVASAILKNPAMKENCVVIWLGGHAVWEDYGATEFNMKQDIAAARVVIGCGIPVVQLPCKGVVDRFAASKYELRHWLKGKNKLCDYLYENTVEEAESYAKDKPWTRVIWDVTAVAWLFNGEYGFMNSKLIPSPIPEYDGTYSFDESRHFINFVCEINRDALFEDLFRVLGE